MIEWRRVELSMQVCGGCGKLIPKGDPIQVTTITGIQRLKYRGECCAGDAPPDLGEVVTRRNPPKMKPLMLNLPQPKTRGEMKRLVAAIPEEWTPYRDSE